MSRTRRVEERALTRRERGDAGRLLADEWGAAWRANAYAGPHAPQFRVIELDRSGAVIGHVSAFAIPTAPEQRLVGIGDLVVDPRHRRRGVARRICAEVVEHCWERGADVVLVDTVDAAPVFAALGFTPVTDFSFFYERDRACHRHRHWLVARRTGATAAPRTQLLEHGDF